VKAMTDFLPLMLFLISSTLTPGPNNFLVMNSGLQFGIQRTLPHFFGICLGFPMMVLLVALGLGTIFTKYLWIKDVLKVVGTIYLVYLAWQIYRSHASKKEDAAAKPFSFIQALLFQWVNPKAWLMGIGAISIYTVSSNYFYNALILSFCFFIVCAPGVAIWMVFGKYLQKLLTEERHYKWFNTAMAVALAASVILIYLD
jgi:threonine/homoserine/homoserine lactone efflux protein